MTERADIEALLALLAKATTADPRHARLAQCFCVACEDRERFYVAAVNALPALCAELREARAKAAAWSAIERCWQSVGEIPQRQAYAMIADAIDAARKEVSRGR